MFYKQSGKLIIAFTATLLLVQCQTRKSGNGVVTYIKSQPLSKTGFAAFCTAQHLDIARVTLAISRNVYRPDDQNCGTEMPVYEKLNFSYGQIEQSLQQQETLKSLLAYTAALYKLMAEPVTLGEESATRKSINYFDRTLSCRNLFDSLSTAAWAFDCGGQAEMAKVFLDSLGHKKYYTKTAQLSRKAGDEVNHIVALVYYRQNEQWFGVAIDCQNGNLGPVNQNKDSIPSIAELSEALNLNQTAKYEVLSIPESDLHKKRNLMNHAFYCNVLPDSQSVYHLAYSESGYKYERLTYSMLYYSWFKSGIINSKKYGQNLVQLLVKNAPQN